MGSTRRCQFLFKQSRDDARLIHTSVTAHALWWASFQTTQARMIVSIDGQLFPWGAEFSQSYLTLLSFGTTQTCPLLPSHVSTYCSHTSSLNKPRSSQKS